MKALPFLLIAALPALSQPLSIHWEELTAADFTKALVQSQTTCTLPFGIVEKHGPSAPLGTDPKGDAAPGDDLVALFAVKDGSNVSLRVDAVLARDAGENQPPVVNAGANQTITLPAARRMTACPILRAS